MAVVMPTHLGRIIGQTLNGYFRFRELENRTARLEQYQRMQHAITRIVAGASELDQAIPRILQAICETTDWDFGEVWHIDHRTNVLVCEASWHVPTLSFPAFEQRTREITFAVGKGLPGRVWKNGKPAWISNVVVDGNFPRAHLAERDGLHGGLAISIRAEGKVIGIMGFFSREIRNPDHELLRVLDTVGSQIGLFVERKRIERIEHEQARTLAALEERQRLARDLHDSVTQTLFSASVIAEMLPILWTRDPDQVRAGLDDLHQLTRDALAEMRSLLVELRPTALQQDNLVDLIKPLVDTLAARSQIQATLEVNSALQSTCGLSPEVQTVLYRITQEAFNNIVKHAQATQVSVQLSGGPEHVELQIRDNGRGFKMDCIPTSHFGLEIIRERAAAIGATFHLNSIPGQGTYLNIVWPRIVQGVV